MVYHLLLHVVEVHDERTVAHEDPEDQLVVRIERLAARLVRQLDHACEEDSYAVCYNVTFSLLSDSSIAGKVKVSSTVRSSQSLFQS